MLRLPSQTATTPDPTARPETLPPRASSPAPRLTWAGREILDDPTTALVLNSVWSGDPLTVVPSPPGSGKTRLVALLAAALSTAAGLRVGIAAQTRSQAVEIATRVHALTPRSVLGWAAKAERPTIPGLTITTGGATRFPTNGGGIVTATTARWLYARPRDLGCDVMLVDEAWQATYADVGALGAFAGQIVCVGDPGQIDPVVTGPTARWQASHTAPNLPAPIALLHAHDAAATRVALRHTWRLGPSTTALIQPVFYTDLPFTSRRPPEQVSTSTGTPLPEVTCELVTHVTGPICSPLINAIADRVTTLLTCTLTTPAGTRPLLASDVAVVVSHVGQAAAVRAALTSHPDVLVGTANQLQGLERHAVVALHNLAGATEVTDFNADPGRACVMLSRHRTHLTVILDATTPALLANTDPAAPGGQLQTALVAHLLA